MIKDGDSEEFNARIMVKHHLVLVVKILLANAQMQEMQVWSLGQEDSLEEEMETQYSIFAWKIP